MTSTYLLCMDVGLGLGAIVLGAAAGVWGYAVLYVLCAVLIAASAVWYWAFHGRFPRAGDSAPDAVGFRCDARPSTRSRSVRPAPAGPPAGCQS